MNNTPNAQSNLSKAQGIVTLIVSVIYLGSCSVVYFFFDDELRLFIIPFVIVGISNLIKGILLIKQGKNMAVFSDPNAVESDIVKATSSNARIDKFLLFSEYIYTLCFFIFWFGFLIFFDMEVLRESSGEPDMMFYFTLIFWAVGIYAFIKKTKELINNTKRNRE
jgi:hypothetical protein